jgi:hypothetical protein
VVDCNESAVGQGFEGGAVGDLCAVLDAVTVKFEVDGVREHGSATPGGFERVEALPAAFGARSVAGGEGNGFIEEEEFGVAAGRHHGAADAFEFEDAGDPAARPPGADDFAGVIMERTAAVAHDRSACWRAEEDAIGIDAVLEGHVGI